MQANSKIETSGTYDCGGGKVAEGSKESDRMNLAANIWVVEGQPG